MRNQNIDQSWQFGEALYDGNATPLRPGTERTVNLPHDYMIETDVTADAPSARSSGFYASTPGRYTRMLDIPAEWAEDEVFLHFDGLMMNATIDINGGRAAYQHYGYAPVSVNITPYLYFGRQNRVTVTLHPAMQPNSRWYSGAGIYRSVELIHVPKLHIVTDGIFGYTRQIEYDENGVPRYAYLNTEIEIANKTLENKIAKVEVFLTRDGSDEVILSRSQRMQINPTVTETAYLTLTVTDPVLWSAETPELYRLHARVTDCGEFRTHIVERENGSVDETSVLFGIKTVTADVNHGLRVNGKTVKLKGGCIHHDNGMLGTVSLFDSEYRKLSALKQIGYNAVRTTHNPPSAALIEACDRLGIYVLDEAFDAWGIMKHPGDYNMFFDTDWEKDLTAFVRRDRSHPSVVMWSTGNEIPERGGMNNGYTLAVRLAETVRRLDPTRPITNGICSYWNGLDEIKMGERLQKQKNASAQNADFDDPENTEWEFYSEPFVNGLDVVGYNYQERRYPKDHEMFPERVMLGTENFPRQIGIHWPMIENTPHLLGDFTWTAVDYLGEAGIGNTIFVDPEDPILRQGSFGALGRGLGFPWRLAHDADVDINGEILPQGNYRKVVWGSEKTYLYSYDPENFSKTELLSPWGFVTVSGNWNWKAADGKPVKVVVFSGAEEVELFLNGESVGKQKAGERLADNMPKSFLFETVYQPGTLKAVSYNAGKECSQDTLKTVGKAHGICLLPEKTVLAADGHSAAYVGIAVVDADGNVVPDAEVKLTASLTGTAAAPSGNAVLAGFGSANPITTENYTSGEFTTYRGRAMAVIRSGYESGSTELTVSADGFESVRIVLDLE